MQASEIVMLLEQNWNRLRDEFNDQWSVFNSSYRQIINQLPAEPKSEDLERTIDAIYDLLRTYDFGCSLLQDLRSQSSNQVRIAKAGIDVIKEQEHIQQLCNRLTEIDSHKAREVEKNSEDKDNAEAGEKE